ncbi:hypothetical protein OHO83_27630 [Streptomyces sp. NBC_00569]|uniref:hypothetical protein n=1 Tax=Streptomyces sp. NBC_00569 TaxID=2975780 RepID=UPI002E81F821|nr:hypothetical protein [Streptomyces sp. NBC_00569]WUB95767.1 hypothetical protein OHO83_27630 [Streptomyces sp. NBC_00569]
MIRHNNPTGLSAMAAFTLFCLPACSARSIEIPKNICDTPVTQGLTAPLLKPAGELSEWHTTGWGEKGRSVCIVSVDRSEALRLRVSWHTDSIDPMKYSSLDNSATGLWEPRRIHHLAESATLGDNGSIATTRCKGKGKWNFTLALKVTRDRKIVHQRKAIDKFMRAYMPATMKTVGCTPP